MGSLTKIAAGIRTWFQGKKTILGGLVLIVAGVAGVALGKLGVADGASLVGFGISICGFSAKTERHQSQMLAALQAVAAAGVDLRLGNRAGALAAVEPIVYDAVRAEAAPPPPQTFASDASIQTSPQVDYEGYVRSHQTPTGGNS